MTRQEGREGHTYATTVHDSFPSLSHLVLNLLRMLPYVMTRPVKHTRYSRCEVIFGHSIHSTKGEISPLFNSLSVSTLIRF